MTVEGRTHWLPSPFMVIATQNPYEQVGIFPLPESQLDRFLFKIHLDYESAEGEHADPEAAAPRPRARRARRHRAAARRRAAADGAGGPRRDARPGRHARLHRRRRPSDADARRACILGASPRAAIHLLAAAKAHARLANRPTVSREDVTDMAPFALPHRLIVDGVDPAAVVRDAVALAAASADGP